MVVKLIYVIIFHNFPSQHCCATVAIEGFVVYTGEDYGLDLNFMLLVQVMGVRDV